MRDEMIGGQTSRIVGIAESGGLRLTACVKCRRTAAISANSDSLREARDVWT
jgi:hypothetical protein